MEDVLGRRDQTVPFPKPYLRFLPGGPCREKLSHFSPVLHFYPRKTSENQRLADVFRGYGNVTLANIGLDHN